MTVSAIIIAAENPRMICLLFIIKFHCTLKKETELNQKERRMLMIICLSYSKGGVGKTTISANLVRVKNKKQGNAWIFLI